MIEEAVMSNRKKSALDPTTQLLVGRLTTQADQLMSAFHTPTRLKLAQTGKRTAAQIGTSRSRIQT
jgi:hypothetical protein